MAFVKKVFMRLVLPFIMWLPIRGIRLFVARCILGHVGKNVSILRNVKFFHPQNIFIGDNTVINQGVLLDGRGGRLFIDSNVDIARETYIWTLEHDVNSSNHSPVGGDVFIGDHVWIASRTNVLPGVTISRGAVVGCGSVVTKDIPELSIVGGVPAKIIGRRNNPLTYVLDFHPIFE